jgi:hypothetical protein
VGKKSRSKRARPHWIDSSPPPRRRSLVEPLMWVGAAALIGFPILRDATADTMVRNEYHDAASCECDYSGAQCAWNGNTRRFVGPWYAPIGTKPAADDPGGGQCRTRHASGYYGSGGGAADYRGPTSVEAGYRGGFGGTGRVRAAGS